VKSALFVQGGWQGHEPEKCAEIISTWLAEQGYHVEVSDTFDSFADREKMMSLSLIVPAWTMGTITDEQAKVLTEVVRSGVGLATWHGGICNSFQENCNYQFMFGGEFIDHPGDIVDYKVSIVKPDDPIVAGLTDFEFHSEQYYMLVAPDNEVLATTTFDNPPREFDWIKGCVVPMVWKRRYGQGRVFYSALGHVPADFQVPQVLAIIQRGILWASR